MMIVYFFASEEVPITGRRQFSYLSRFMPFVTDKDGPPKGIMIWNEGKRYLPDHHPLFHKIEAVFQRLVKAGGLEDRAWEIYVVDNPSM